MKHSPLVLIVVVVVIAGAGPARADDGPGVGTPESAARNDAAVVRPRALTPLLASYVALQALDISSTYQTHGASSFEANPVVRGALESPAALIAMKAGSAALTVAFANRLSRKHPRAAMLLMIGMNSAYATIVAHNYAVAR
jgi:hypothetical protein